MKTITKFYLFVVAGIIGSLMAVPALAVGTSQINLQPVVNDVLATLTANLTIVLAVLSITIGVPLAIHFIRKLLH